MKVLIITQKIDREDPVLGFFHNWVEKMAGKFEKVSVICLEKGEFDLPKNVEVFSLGKKSKKLPAISRIKYITNFYRYILGLHADYDAVFVHMNQEYIVLAGFLWKVMRKKVYFWRNHPKGSLFTYIAVWLSNKVFCTSKSSFTARFNKTVLMPVGIDTDKFIKFENLKVNKVKNSILFLGRISPIKKPELFIEALGIINKKNIDFEANIYGNPLPKDENYYDSLKIRMKELGLKNKVKFHKGVPNYKTPEIYNEHNIFVNLTPAGSFDKTILEAAACGCLLAVTNRSLAGEIDERMIIEKENPENIAERINFLLNITEEERKNISKKLQNYVLENHSLDALVDKLLIYLNENKKR